MLATVPDGELNFVTVDPAIISFAEGDTVSFNITSPYGTYTLSGDVTLTNEDPSSHWMYPQYFDEPALVWSAETSIKDGSYTKEKFAVCVMADGSNRFYSIKWYNVGHGEGDWYQNGPATFAIPQEIHKIPAEYLDVSSDLYHITFSTDLGVAECDKSDADIAAAVQAGKTIVAHYGTLTTTSILAESDGFLNKFEAYFVSATSITLRSQVFSYSPKGGGWNYSSGTATLTTN